MHGQCKARPTVTFPAAAAGHRHPLTGTKLYCLVMETHVCVSNLPKVVVSESAAVVGVEAPQRPIRKTERPNHSTTSPPC